MRFVNVRQLKDQLSEVLHSTETGEDVIVTFRGKPSFVVHHLAEEALEDYILGNHPDFVAKAEEAWNECLQGKVGEDIDTLIAKAQKKLQQSKKLQGSSVKGGTARP